MTPETPQRKHRVAFPTRAAWLPSSQSSYFESIRNRQTKQTHSCPKEVPDLCRHQASLPQLVLSSPSFSRTHRHPLTTIHGLRGPQTHGARLHHRVSAHRKRAPEIVDERPALLGMNRAMLRNLAGPRPARRAQRTHWRRMFGAQVDSNPSHRCPSHVRLSPALVSAPPHVPARPFAWGCGS